jgi:hypothetical protein
LLLPYEDLQQYHYLLHNGRMQVSRPLRHIFFLQCTSSKFNGKVLQIFLNCISQSKFTKSLTLSF